MRKMKDSGVEWIGEIPDDWEVKKLSNVAPIITDFVASGSFSSLNKNVKYIDSEDYAMLIRTTDLSGSRDKKVYINKHSYEFLSNSNLFGGEIILSNIGSVGNVYFYDPLYIRSSLGPNSIMINGSDNNKFLYYWFLSPTANKRLTQIGNNAVQLKFNKTQLRQFKVIFPPLETQTRIADYLDQKCEKIDSILAGERQAIDKLKEYKLSMFNDVFISQNGISCHLGYISELKNGLNFTAISTGETMRFLGVGDFHNHIILDDKQTFSNVMVANEIPQDYLLKNEDIIFVRSNGSKNIVGRSVMVRNIDFPLTYSGFCIRFRNTRPDIVNNYYLLYFFQSPLFRNELKKYSQGSNINNINQEVLSKISLVIPSLSEQQAIADYLDQKCEKIDAVIEGKEKLIEKLTDYKKSLIYEVVTGKKEV